MPLRTAFACAMLTLAVTTLPLWAKSEVKLTNPKVRVVDYFLAPGEQATIVAGRPSVFVVIAGTGAKLGFTDGSKRSMQLARGMTLAQDESWISLTNSGAAPLDLIRIEFLSVGLDHTWGMQGLSPHCKILVEDCYNRSYDIRIAAHGREPQHTHHGRVVICLDGAKLEHILPDGSAQPSTLVAGEVAWRPGQTHVGHNLGDTDLWVIAVEPK